ncbi:hypothetical protein Vau01_113440 [Virgisporangium aurantiacum]|uniref:YcaO domain-containing protein n=1 Tax=Virgisporangium aurantiacum TaxID=175570 RepID=A0A8J3ZJB0_9ACTN|nr:hypothetical protein Vau01_113440 [Virgisporangium aurantiacum]
MRRDARYVEMPAGVYVLSHQGEVVLRGTSVAAWLRRLAPALDGSRSIAELTRGLSAERASHVGSLVRTLVDAGVAREVSGMTEPADFFRYFGGDLADALADRVLVTGSGPLLAEVEAATRRCGMSSVRVPGEPEDPSVADADLVIHVSASPSSPYAGVVERLCAEAGVLLAEAVLTGGEVLWCVGGRWSSAWRRLLANGVPPAGADDPVALRIAANSFVHHVVRVRTGTLTTSANTLTSVRLDSLDTRQHRFLPHPALRPAAEAGEGAFLARINALAAGPELTVEEFDRRAATLMDDRFGVFTDITEGDYTQLPLHVAESTVSDPMNRLSGERPVVYGSGLTFEEARYATARAALATAGVLTVDRRRLIRHDRGDRARGVRLTDGKPVLIGAQRVFGERSADPTGAAAGASWRAAVEHGLLGYATDLALSAATEPPTVRLDESRDAEIRQLGILLAAVDEDFTLYDATDPLGIPTFVCTGGDLVAAASGMSSRAAAVAAMYRLLLRHQARTSGERAYEPAAPPGLPRLVPRAVTPLVDRTVDISTAAGILGRSGRTLAAVPLDHDEEVHDIMPYVVRVVPTDAG